VVRNTRDFSTSSPLSTQTHTNCTFTFQTSLDSNENLVKKEEQKKHNCSARVEKRERKQKTRKKTDVW
jgi:Ulp1 family protease